MDFAWRLVQKKPKKKRLKERREKCSSRPSVEEVLVARYPALTSNCVRMNKIILQVFHTVCVCTTNSPINPLLKNGWETCKFLVWQIEMKQAHAGSIIAAFNPQAFDWASGVMYNLFSAEPRVLFISAENCFHFCWSHCFLRHEQTDWTESKQNYFFVSENRECLGCFSCLHTLPTLHPPVFTWSPHPCRVGFCAALKPVLRVMVREGGGLLAGVSTGTELAKILQTRSPCDFSRWIFPKCLCSKVWILILSESNATEVYMLNTNCYANAINSWLLYRNLGMSGRL